MKFLISLKAAAVDGNNFNPTNSFLHVAEIKDRLALDPVENRSEGPLQSQAAWKHSLQSFSWTFVRKRCERSWILTKGPGHTWACCCCCCCLQVESVQNLHPQHFSFDTYPSPAKSLGAASCGFCFLRDCRLGWWGTIKLCSAYLLWSGKQIGCGAAELARTSKPPVKVCRGRRAGETRFHWDPAHSIV